MECCICAAENSVQKVKVILGFLARPTEGTIENQNIDPSSSCRAAFPFPDIYLINFVVHATLEFS